MSRFVCPLHFHTISIIAGVLNTLAHTDCAIRRLARRFHHPFARPHLSTRRQLGIRARGARTPRRARRAPVLDICRRCVGCGHVALQQQGRGDPTGHVELHELPLPRLG